MIINADEQENVKIPLGVNYYLMVKFQHATVESFLMMILSIHRYLHLCLNKSETILYFLLSSLFLIKLLQLMKDTRLFLKIMTHSSWTRAKQILAFSRPKSRLMWMT